MDSLTFISPANVRVLLVPINELKQSDFETILGTLRRVKDVRAVDLTHNPGKFNPQAYPQGHIYFNFITRDDDAESLFLHDFEPFRKTAIVIGVAKWNSELTDDSMRQLSTQLKKKYPTPISHFTMIFDCPDGHSNTVSNSYVVDSNNANLETKVCDMTSKFLSNFSTYASAYEHTTLRSPGSINEVVKTPKHKLSSSFDLNSEKIRQFKLRGRKLKLNANFYLLAGNWKSALSDFSEAIYNLKSSSDYLWLASALDGLAVCILLLSSIGAPYQLPPFLNSLLDTANNIQTILSPSTSPRTSIQSVSSNLASIENNTESPIIPVIPLNIVQDTIYKCGKMASLYYEKLKTSTNEIIPQIVIECLVRYATLLVLTGTESPFDMSLVNEIIFNNPRSTLKPISEIFDLNQFNKLCSHIFEGDFTRLSVTEQLKISFTMISLYSKTNMKMKKCLMIKKFVDSLLVSEGMHSILNNEHNELEGMLKDYCEHYGIVAQKFEKIKKPSLVQKKIILQILALCKKIGYSKGYIEYATFALKYFYLLLNAQEQVEIFENIKDLSHQNNSTPEYWDNQMFLDFEFERKANEIVEGENCYVSVFLRNPYAFEVQVKNFKLCVEDDFPLSLLVVNGKKKINQLSKVPLLFLKPYSEYAYPLILIPEKHGKLTINGISATVEFCQHSHFSVKLPSVVSFPPKLNKKAFFLKEVNNELKSWTVNVVHKQPLLKFVDVNLSDKWIMILDGEHKQFKVTLKNISNTEINCLVSKFKDSNSELLVQELNNKLLQANEIYELEYQILKRKTFKILNKDSLGQIKGYQTFDLDVEIIGKIGIKEANILLEYSYQKDLSSEFKRMINVPLHLTVYRSVELSGCDIIPLTSNTKLNENNSDPCWKYLRKMKERKYELSSFCLVALDFVNMWSEDMDILVEYHPQETENSTDESTEKTLRLKTLLPSRKNTRIFVPFLRLDFDDEYLNRRIPSLRNKQFIVDKKTPLAEQAFIKHSFWYKEEILKRINATWRTIPHNESNSINQGRSGDIDMRSFRFSSKMLEILEIEKVQITVELLDKTENPVDMKNVSLNTFYTVRLTLNNRNKNSIFGMIRHILVCKDPPYTYEKKVLINGVLQSSVGDPLKPGESRTFDLGTVFLEKGEYEWGALFDQIDDWDKGNMTINKQYLQREQLKIDIH